MCLDGQAGAFAVFNKTFSSRKLYDGFVVLLTGTEHLMTAKEHSRGLQKLPVQCSQSVCKRCKTFEESEKLKKSEPTNVRRKTNLSASSVVPLIRKPSSKHFFHHFHFSGDAFDGKSCGLNFMGDRRGNTAHRQLLRGT